jgi:hypothetical protein
MGHIIIMLLHHVRIHQIIIFEIDTNLNNKNQFLCEMVKKYVNARMTSSIIFGRHHNEYNHLENKAIDFLKVYILTPILRCNKKTLKMISGL